MTIRKILTIFSLVFLTLNPLRVMAQDKPIVLTVSRSKNPPVAGANHMSIGYWDVDDYDGNGGAGGWTKYLPPYKFDGDNRTASSGTCYSFSDNHYMATLAINTRSLSQITNLRLVADYDPKALKNHTSKAYGNCRVMEANDRGDYLVGWWDVDGGGGHGSDGSSGSRYLAFFAEYGDSASDRKLLDLQLVASNKKKPALKTGYQIVGYWDVDKGGSRGTDGSTGHYMMTLLAKWDR